MTINLPPKVRLAIYVLAGVGQIIIAYAKVKGYIGQDEVNLFAALSVFAFSLAAINVDTK